jgi:hypothetical protein
MNRGTFGVCSSRQTNEVMQQENEKVSKGTKPVHNKREGEFLILEAVDDGTTNACHQLKKSDKHGMKY